MVFGIIYRFDDATDDIIGLLFNEQTFQKIISRFVFDFIHECNRQKRQISSFYFTGDESFYGSSSMKYSEKIKSFSMDLM